MFRYQVFIQQPTRENLVWNDFLKPFTLVLWCTVSLSIMVLSICLTTFHAIGRRFGNEEIEGPHTYNFYNSLHFVFGIFCQQGHDNTPRANSCRIVYLTAYLTAMIVFYAYSASLISHLTKKTTSMPFNDLKGLMKDGTYRLGVIKDTAEYDTFRKSKNSLMREVYEKLIIRDEMPLTDVEGIVRLCSSRYAFISSGLKMKSLQAPCKLSALTGVSFDASISLVLTKDSPYRNVINYNLHKLRNSGTLERLKYIWWKPDSNQESDEWNDVDFNSFAPILIVLFFGMWFAGFLLLAEIKWNRINYVQKSINKTIE
ncbi:hypothetical protein L9F63_016465 [Diploptera punctata]|uniref:Ionotropic glutamate receptor C-terminal domain-containing protein n=1 Tax=Diploptera punctata TaxID=6984 RepID=A0AAD8A118_DIPPU|nr:hypothetical protein L9F63_016465 [Diploptera punctata]